MDIVAESLAEEIYWWDDDKEILEYMESRLSSRLEQRNLNSPVPIKICFLTREKFIDEILPKDGVKRQFIVDLRDAEDRQMDSTNLFGLEILSYIQSNYPNAEPIVYTGNPSFAELCRDKYGVSSENFITKNHTGQLEDDVEALARRIEYFFDRYLVDKQEPREEESSDENHSPEIQTLQGQGLSIINKPGTIQHLQYRSLQILDTNSKNYEELAFSAQTYLCKGLITIQGFGNSFLNLDVPYWETRTAEMSEMNLRYPESGQYPNIIQIVNRDNFTLEGLTLSQDGRFDFRLFCPTVDTLVAVVSTFERYCKDISVFARDLIAFFICKRLCDLFNQKEPFFEIPVIKRFIAGNWSSTGQNLIKIGFWTRIFERLTLTETEDLEETNKILASLNQEHPHILDVLYAQVQSHQEDGTALVSLASVEDLELPFQEYMELDFLLESGVSNEDATFRFILFKNTENSDLIGRSQQIEPLLQESYLLKLNPK